MSFSLKQLVLIIATFICLLIQLRLRRASVEDQDAALKVHELEEAMMAHHFNNHNQQKKERFQYNFHQKPNQVKVRQPPIVISSNVSRTIPENLNLINERSKHNDFTKSRMESSRAQYIKVCKSLPNQRQSRAAKYSSYAFARLRWCSVPKSGSTFLTRELRPTLREKGDFDGDAPKRFILVREPYSRLVSAFFSKIVGHPAWWFAFGAKLISKFRSNPSADSLRCGHDVTFQEFIKYFIYSCENSWYTNAHFLPIHSVCNMCDDPPDFIAKIETMKSDMDFILNSVNVSGETGKSFIEVKHLAVLFMSYKTRFQGCGSMCSLLKRFWWGQQATGLISKDLPLPVKDQAACDRITGEQLADLAWKAHADSVARIGNKHLYKLNMATELWRQVPLADRSKIRDLLSLDCRLFGYDCSPKFVFPEDTVV